MSRPWHQADTALFEKEKTEVEAAYPNLHFYVAENIVFVRGSFPIVFDGEEFDRYLIEIKLPRDYPKSIPVVREVGGRIPLTSDRHMNPRDGTACVLLPDERWRVWPPGSGLLDFLNGPVRNFFLGQSVFELEKRWPFGQWGHGGDGVRQFYSELLETDDVEVVIKAVEYLTKKKTKGHWPCYCKSGKPLRDCHGEKLRGLTNKIPRAVALSSYGKLIETFRPSRRL